MFEKEVQNKKLNIFHRYFINFEVHTLVDNDVCLYIYIYINILVCFFF